MKGGLCTAFIVEALDEFYCTVPFIRLSCGFWHCLLPVCSVYQAKFFGAFPGSM